MALTARVGDVGAVLRLTIERDGTALDISGAGTKTIKVYDPDRVLAATITATFTNTGTDGQLQATLTSACFDRAGTWTAVAYLGSLSGFSGHTSPVSITVRPVAVP